MYISLYYEFNLMIKVCRLVIGIYVDVINDRLLWENSWKILFMSYPKCVWWFLPFDISCVVIVVYFTSIFSV